MRRTAAKEKTKKRTAEKIREELDLPQIVLSDLVHIELSGNKEAVVDGCKGILEYDDTVVRLNTGRLIIRFLGTDLTIRTMTLDQAIVGGTILSVEFST